MAPRGNSFDYTKNRHEITVYYFMGWPIVFFVSDYMIVKCFKDCGQKKFGHYHCVFCKEQIIKRTAYGRHLSRHMKKKVHVLKA